MPQYQGIWTLAQAAQLQSTQRWATDPLFENTTLLLQADNAANGAQNNTFLDSSSNAFAITRNGNTTQGSFTPFSQSAGWWSDYNASTASLCVGIYLNGETDFAFGTGDFTIEMWVNLQSKTPGHVLYDSRPDATNGFYPTVYVDGSVNKLKYFTNAADRITQTSTFTYNVWHHIVVTRTGTSTKMFVDGVQEGSTYTDSNTYINGALRPFTGDGFTPNPTSGGYGVLGNISNLRVVKGSGPYQSAGSTITVPTTPLTPITNTVLLTLQSNRFLDTNTQVAAKTINLFNGPSVQAFSPFAPQYQYTPSVTGGSGYFDGSGDFLTTPSTAALSYGTSDYSQEFWIYLTTSPATFQRPLQYSDDRDNIVVESGNFNFFDGTASTISAATTGQWFHLCVTRVGGTLRGFVNGRLGFTRSGTYNSSTRSLALGATSGGANPLGGYTTNYRIVKGGIPTAYSTSSTTVGAQIFTPPTTPFTGSESLTAGSVSLLLNFTNAGIVDGTMKNNLETVGNAQVSTSVVKYGTGSMAFDGTNDALALPNSPVLQLGSADFTCEFWAYRLAATNMTWVFLNGNSSNFAALRIDTDTSGNVFLLMSTSGSAWAINTSGSAVLPLSTWTHIAAVRFGGAMRLYLNGVALISTTISGSLTAGTSQQVGANFGATQVVNGYVDDLRLTNGIARYTANFTPPSVALPRQ